MLRNLLANPAVKKKVLKVLGISEKPDAFSLAWHERKERKVAKEIIV